MCRIIAIANQKGGVGKTTTCVNLGIGLARAGKKVLLVEADAQGSMAVSLGIQEPDELDVTLVNIMEKVINDEDVEPGEGIIRHEEGIDFIPANIELAGLETSLVNVMSREQVLRLYLEGVKADYDYILIDCMPSLGMITINALVAADSVLIPVEAAYLPVKGLQQLIKTIGKVHRRLNPRLSIMGILLTKVDRRTTLHGIFLNRSVMYTAITSISLRIVSLCLYERQRQQRRERVFISMIRKGLWQRDTAT